jgi:hypothetical protein
MVNDAIIITCRPHFPFTVPTEMPANRGKQLLVSGEGLAEQHDPASLNANAEIPSDFKSLAGQSC